MSENSQGTTVNLNGLYLFKEGMATVYGSQGESIPVTVLRYEQNIVSQVKNKAKDGYDSVQVALSPLKGKNSNKAEVGHLKKAGLEVATRFVREFRGESEATVGAVVSIESIAKGDVVKVTSVSKGKGFAGSVKRFGFAGGPASHGSKFHRQPGSSGNRTWPGRVMPGKKFPGHLGSKSITVKNVQVVEVMASEGVILVKGPIPGARNTLVKMVK